MTDGGQITVLLVDDDQAVREVTSASLQDLGFGVVEADGGLAALAHLEAIAAIDIMLVDFAMPGMNGAEVARRARKQRPKLPILFVTGYADAEALSDVPDTEIVRKPFRDQDLADRIATLTAGA